MKFPTLTVGLAISALAGFVAAASAMPPLQLPPQIRSEAGIVELVGGCHRDVRRRFVPEIGRRAWHFHRGARCRPILVDRPRARDCHRDVRRHFVPGIGRVWHRHTGPGCRVRIARRF